MMTYDNARDVILLNKGRAVFQTFKTDLQSIESTSRAPRARLNCHKRCIHVNIDLDPYMLRLMPDMIDHAIFKD